MGPVVRWIAALAAIAALGAAAGVYFAMRPGSTVASAPPATIPLNPSSTASPSASGSPEPLPPTVLLPVPYTDQAPLGDWAAKQHTCEEASLAMVDRYLAGDHSGTQIDPQPANAAIDRITPWKPAVDLTTEQVGQVATQHLGWSHEVLPATRENMEQQLALGRPLIVGVRTHGLGNSNYPGYTSHHEQPGWSVSHYLVVTGYDQSGSFVLNDPGITRGHGYSITYDQLMHAIDDLDQAYPSLNSGRVVLVLAPPASS